MNISIKKPCHEDWNKMTPNEKGVFCLVCTKDVVDFSKKTLEEIKSYFSQPREGTTCGKFNNDQLIALNFDSFFERFTGFKLTRKVAFVIAVTFMSWFMGGSKLSAQDDHVKGKVGVKVENPPVKQDTTKTVKNPEIQTKGEVCTDPKTTKKPKTKTKSKTKTTALTPKKTKEPAPHLLGDVDVNYDEKKKDEKKN
ncbi:MAG: hypothetical protein Q8M29_05900 [Bacteroidota bacterium]|nr:hypothetical protein [Bacteroidota bacterium]